MAGLPEQGGRLNSPLPKHNRCEATTCPQGWAGDGVGAGGWGGDGGLIIMIGTCERGLGQVHRPYQRGSAGAQCDLTVIRCQNEMVAL